MAGQQPGNRWAQRRGTPANAPVAPHEKPFVIGAENAQLPGIVRRNRATQPPQSPEIGFNRQAPAPKAPAAPAPRSPQAPEVTEIGYSRPAGTGFMAELSRAREEETEADPFEDDAPVAFAPDLYEDGLSPEEPSARTPRTARGSRSLQQGPVGQPAPTPQAIWMQPKVLVPALAIVLVLGLAFGFSPGGRGATLAESYGSPTSAAVSITTGQTPAASTTPVASPTKAGTNPSPVPANLTVSALATQNANRNSPNQEGIAHPETTPTNGGTGTNNANASLPGSTNQVAGVQASATPEPTVSYTPTQCGTIQETATQVSVEQTLSGVSVKATQAAVYPIAYLRCILMATGSRDSMAIAGSLDKAEREGATHGAVIDLWVTNSQKDFAQVNLKTAIVAAVGQTFSPLATLNGRADLVVSGGQGRSVGLVVAMTQALDTSVGPMTVQIEGPMLGGKLIPGKYQLFLPTP